MQPQHVSQAGLLLPVLRPTTRCLNVFNTSFQRQPELESTSKWDKKKQHQQAELCLQTF